MQVAPEALSHDSAATDSMVWIQGNTFRMGSDRHYSEEAPAHEVTVDGFWIDPTPSPIAIFSDLSRRPAMSPSLS